MSKPPPLYITIDSAPTLGQAVASAYAQAPKGARPVACFGRIEQGRLVGVVVRFEPKGEGE